MRKIKETEVKGGHTRDSCNYMVRVEQPTKQI